MNSVLDSDKIDLFGEKRMETSPTSDIQTTTARAGIGLTKDADKNCTNGNRKVSTSNVNCASNQNSATDSSGSKSLSTHATMTNTADQTTNTSIENNDIKMIPSTTPVKIGPNQPASQDPVDTIGPIPKKPKSRPTPYAKTILVSSDRREGREKKRISWPRDEEIQRVRYFEMVDGERLNVYSTGLYADPAQPSDGVGGPSPNRAAQANNIDGLYKKPNGKTESDKPVEYSTWRPLILIDFTPTLPSPGWNSIERTAQAEREVYVLGAIDLPGKPSTLDEPDMNMSATKEETSDTKIIPLENPDGMFTKYPDMYNSEIVNGVRINSDNSPSIVQDMTPFLNQQTQSQLLPNQFQQQLIQATSQNPFSFQEMSAQFQQQQPLPFQHQQMMPMPFANPGQQMQLQPQQQPPNQQATNVPGPIVPWLQYPFNPVNDNSHAHLFKRPAT